MVPLLAEAATGFIGPPRRRMRIFFAAEAMLMWGAAIVRSGIFIRDCWVARRRPDNEGPRLAVLLVIGWPAARQKERGLCLCPPFLRQSFYVICSTHDN